MSGIEWCGAAGAEVRRCMALLQRTSTAVDEAMMTLRAARAELEAAERDLDVAKRVYFAGRKDLQDQAHVLKITPQKEEWLKELSKYEIFGAGEMRKAADVVGWKASEGAIRTAASEYRKAGYFVRVEHGVIRLNRDRIQTALGPILDRANDPEQDESLLSKGHLIELGAVAQVLGSVPDRTSNVHEELIATTSLGDSNVVEADSERRRSTDDYLDDDLPF